LRSLLGALHINRLQRKVLVVVVAIILGPMLVTGLLSADWITGRIDGSIERWIREAAQVNEQQLVTLQGNARLFADLLREETSGVLALERPVPLRLEPLAQQLGITLLQIYDAHGALIYSSAPVTLERSWAADQDQAVVKVSQGEQRLLAAVAIVPLGERELVLGSLFDKGYLLRLNQSSGLRTRIFYPRAGDFAKAFSEESRPLRLRLPAEAFAHLTENRPYYSNEAENGRFWGLYTPLLDATGHMEAVLFSGLEHHGGDQLLTDRGLLTLGIFLLGLLVAGVTGLLLSHLVAKPVAYLRDAALRVAAHDFRAAVPITSRDELGDLARTFNGMAESLRQARDAQIQQFRRDKLTALGELALAMAHEIRNPLGVIQTAARLLERNPTDTERRTELTQMIGEESRRLNQLLNDFRQLARHRVPQVTLINPVEPLEQAARALLAAHEEVSLVHDYRHDDIRIEADPEQLREAWLNLVKNALEAMGEQGGQLTLATRRLNGEVRVSLTDSGPGIPVELMPRLFEPFFSSKAQGTGLGLALANRLVEANGGRLEPVPDIPHGACFMMSFPLATQEI